VPTTSAPATAGASVTTLPAVTTTRS
jgi:hypothetical protein